MDDVEEPLAGQASSWEGGCTNQATTDLQRLILPATSQYLRLKFSALAFSFIPRPFADVLRLAGKAHWKSSCGGGLLHSGLH